MDPVIEPADAQELNRLLAEGNIRLRRSREALKNSSQRLKDWEEITPTQLRLAIKHLRDEFKSHEFQMTQRAESGCDLALHPDMVMQPTFKGGFTNPIPQERRAAWRQFYTSATEPAIFRFWCDQLSDSLVDSIRKAFERVLTIALAQRVILPLELVEWAMTIVQGLLFSLEWTWPSKLKAMCDEQMNRTDFANQYFLAYCAWVYWRAPRFVHMRPSGKTPYDPKTAWDREDEDMTERLLHGLTERVLDPARFALDDLAGEAYVSLASRPSAEQQAPARTRTDQPAARAGDEAAFPSIERKKLKELPKKGRDFSNFFDQARLTDRQRECASLNPEYGLTVTAIADRLGITRKTVDEHLEAAERKIELARAKDSARGRKNRFNPGE